MYLQDTHHSILSLIRLGIGYNIQPYLSSNNWERIQALAKQQGLSAIILDGIDKLPAKMRPPKTELLQWIGEVLQGDAVYALQWESACEMSLLFENNHIRTYILKGFVIAECYPKPTHRVSADLDFFLTPHRGNIDAWELGNQLMEQEGYEVDKSYYKNSKIYIKGLTLENHKFMTPFRGNKKLMNLEIMLQNMMKDGYKFEGTYLYRPPVMVSALLLIEHAYSHFLHEGLTWRHVLDWMMFHRMHKAEIDWNTLDVLIDKYSLRNFYDSFYRLGKFLLGELQEEELKKVDKRMLADVWAPLDLHKTVHGVIGKIALAGNTLRAWWKYHYFAPISMPHALWIQVKGYLFDKNPKLR